MWAVGSSRDKPRQDHLGRLVGIVAGLGLGHGENGTIRTRVRAMARVVLSVWVLGESCIWATLLDGLESGSGAGCKKSWDKQLWSLEQLLERAWSTRDPRGKLCWCGPGAWGAQGWPCLLARAPAPCSFPWSQGGQGGQQMGLCGTSEARVPAVPLLFGRCSWVSKRISFFYRLDTL